MSDIASVVSGAESIGGDVIIHNNTAAVVQNAAADSLTMIASDGILHNGFGHPRIAGTYRQPTLPPIGMEYVLVNGTVLVRHGHIVEDRLPGRPVRAPER